MVGPEEIEPRASKMELLIENLKIVMDEYYRQNSVYFENVYVYDPMFETKALMGNIDIADDESGYSQVENNNGNTYFQMYKITLQILTHKLCL